MDWVIQFELRHAKPSVIFISKLKYAVDNLERPQSLLTTCDVHCLNGTMSLPALTRISKLYQDYVA